MMDVVRIFNKNNFIIVFFTIALFSIDRFTKIKIINLLLNNNGSIYINDYLNLDLVWNTGIGFGLASMEKGIYYHALTLLILMVNFVLIYLLIKSKGIYSYLLAIIIGGSLGNLFDRIYYFAVPDFIDLHLGDYDWFIFNVADIFITVGIIGYIFVELFKKEPISKNV